MVWHGGLMACKGLTGDYLCSGWVSLAQHIRQRDVTCRGCDRGAEDIRLEVHHRRYGTPGTCGSCVLTQVDENDLTLLCVECHDAITNVRRRIREKPDITPTFVAPPTISKFATTRMEAPTPIILESPTRMTQIILSKPRIEAIPIPAPARSREPIPKVRFTP